MASPSRSGLAATAADSIADRGGPSSMPSESPAARAARAAQPARTASAALPSASKRLRQGEHMYSVIFTSIALNKSPCTFDQK